MAYRVLEARAWVLGSYSSQSVFHAPQRRARQSGQMSLYHESHDFFAARTVSIPRLPLFALSAPGGRGAAADARKPAPITFSCNPTAGRHAASSGKATELR